MYEVQTWDDDDSSFVGYELWETEVAAMGAAVELSHGSPVAVYDEHGLLIAMAYAGALCKRVREE